MATLTAKARRAIKSGNFAVPGKRKLPIEDEGHVQSAMGRVSQTKGLTPGERKTAKVKIAKAAKKLGIKQEKAGAGGK